MPLEATISDGASEAIRFSGIFSTSGDGVTIVDTGAAVARQLERVLHEHGIAAPAGTEGDEHFWTSGDPTEAARVMSVLLGRTIDVEKLPV